MGCGASKEPAGAHYAAAVRGGPSWIERKDGTVSIAPLAFEICYRRVRGSVDVGQHAHAHARRAQSAERRESVLAAQPMPCTAHIS